MRRRAFLTTDAEGREFCLRPDFTIPVSLHHLNSTKTGGVDERDVLRDLVLGQALAAVLDELVGGRGRSVAQQA